MAACGDSLLVVDRAGGRLLVVDPVTRRTIGKIALGARDLVFAKVVGIGGAGRASERPWPAGRVGVETASAAPRPRSRRARRRRPRRTAPAGRRDRRAHRAPAPHRARPGDAGDELDAREPGGVGPAGFAVAHAVERLVDVRAELRPVRGRDDEHRVLGAQPLGDLPGDRRVRVEQVAVVLRHAPDRVERLVVAHPVAREVLADPREGARSTTKRPLAAKRLLPVPHGGRVRAELEQQPLEVRRDEDVHRGRRRRGEPARTRCRTRRWRGSRSSTLFSLLAHSRRPIGTPMRFA